MSDYKITGREGAKGVLTQILPDVDVSAGDATHEQMLAHLLELGFVCGPRDPRINRNYEGRFMVVESHEETELPTDDGRNGPWCVVGDNLEALVKTAYGLWATELPKEAKQVVAS